MKRLALLAPALALTASGCAHRWVAQSPTHATVYSTTSEIPVIMGKSTYVGAVDGVATERGKGYVLVEPGTHQLTIFRVNCPLPILVVTCLHGLTKLDVPGVLEAGAVYRVDESSPPPNPIQADGRPK
jgi:hypothetical protein